MEKKVNYENPLSGVVHEGGIYAPHLGVTMCSHTFSVHKDSDRPWRATAQAVTCKKCAPPKKLIIQVDKNVFAFGIDTDEKATLATIRARILSMLESWEKHAKGETSKKDFYSALRWDLGDTDEDLHRYMRMQDDKMWCNERRAFVKRSEIKHNLDGRVPSYYLYKCCQSNTCKCGKKVVK